MGAEIYLDSVIFRDVAYQADPGFIADKQGFGGASVPSAQHPAGPAASAPPADKAPDDSDLSRYLLDNLLK
jgi:hypothetical protein